MVVDSGAEVAGARGVDEVTHRVAEVGEAEVAVHRGAYEEVSVRGVG